MDIEKSESPRKRKSTASFATTVFQESTIGTVSTLCLTSSKPRKVFKVLAFILCLSGFIYQSETFLSVVFQYPTRVSLDISRPDMLISPAYTFCDNNGINRRIFCEKHPELCKKPTKEFCKKNKYYCGKNNSLIPTEEKHDWDQYTTLENLPKYSVKMEDFVRITNMEVEENVTGPYLRLADNNRYSLLCYSAFSRVNNSLDLHQVAKSKLFRETAAEFQFNVRSDETFFPGKRSGILFSIHNPFEAVNPFEGGVFMKPGRDYLIFVSTEEEIMLKEPYDTNCKNYTETWEENGRIGPRTEKTCVQECLVIVSMGCFNCVAAHVLVETNERICTKDEMSVCDLNSKEEEDVYDSLLKCLESCRDDCRKIKFTYSVQERFRPRFDEEGEEIDDSDNIINVKIYLEGDEIMVVRHSPKYMIVEVFSSIGGFIGVWLGINLLHILDIFEGIYRVIHYSLKKI